MLTSAQVSEWQAYDRLDPIGEQRADYRNAQLCALIMNLALQIHGGKNSKSVSMEDYLFNYAGERVKDKPRKKQTIAEMKKVLYRWAGKEYDG